MANEAVINSTLQINKGNLSYLGRPTSFTATVTGTKGPTPGAISATLAGTQVDLSELTQPGLCRIMNLDATNFVEYGIWDTENSVFFPLGELLPGESYVLRLSRNIQEEYTGTGTGTTAPTNKLMFKANTAACVVLVEAFET